MNFPSLDLCRELHELSAWDNTASTGHKDRLQVWIQQYSTWEMGEGNPDYGKTGVQQRGVDAYDWRVTDDPRHRLSVPEVVFNWWYSEVRKLEDEAIPAYDADYLCGKLKDYDFTIVNLNHETLSLTSDSLDEPEGAILGVTLAEVLCLLAIALFCQGVLQPTR